MRIDTIRSRLVLLVLGLFSPLAIYIAGDIFQDWRASEVRTRETLRQAVEGLSQEVDQKVALVRKRLELMASRPLVRKLDPTQCDPLINEILPFLPGHANIGYTDLQGNTVCAAVKPADAKPVNLASAPWFQALLRNPRFQVSAPILGPLTGKWVLVMSTPIRDDAGQMIGAIHLPMELEALRPTWPSTGLPPDTRFGFFDTEGVMVWRNVDPDGSIGKKLETDLVKRGLAQRRGHLEGKGTDGVDRLVSIVPVAEPNWIAFITTPSDSALGAIRSDARRAGVLALILLGALMAGTLVVARAIERPIAQLARVANRAHRGDRAVTAELNGPREVAAMAREFNDLMASVRQSEISLKAERDRSQGYLDTVRTIILSLDKDGRVSMINRFGSEVMGWAPKDLVGRSWFETCLPQPEGLEVFERFKELLDSRGKEISEFENEVVTRNGEIRQIAWRNSVIFDDQGVPQGTLSAGEDITNRRAAERELERHRTDLESLVNERTAEVTAAKEAAEAASRAKSEFVARMSHELRTPLNAVLGFTQLMQSDGDHPVGPENLKRLEQVELAGSHLLSLINDLLDLSRIEAGTVSLQLESLDALHLVRQVLRDMQPAAERRGVGLRLTEPEAGAPRVLADRTRLLQVLINLLSNAIKYNVEGGRVDVDVSAQGDAVSIVVRDTGVGMNPEQLQSLFQPFNRLGREQTSFEGTGIGLVIARSLVELMGGSMGVESAAGEGSTFTVHLRAAPQSLDAAPPLDAATPTAETLAPQALSGRVLYIDDDEMNRMLMKAFMERMPGVELVMASDGPSGLSLAQEVRPDLILLDLMMPGMSGVEVLAALRKEDAFKATPCLALSANAMPQDIDETLTKGFSGYLTKPLKLRTLQVELVRYLGHAPAERQI